MARTDWFEEARFGMFIHWGAYSVLGRGEWAANRERIPFAEYRDKYAKKFKAEEFNPRGWARLAKTAGMKYVVLTTRHHDGFALWNTATSEFNAKKIGPRRDLVAEFAEGVRAEGLKVGFYYSGADWYHPDYPDAYARDWPAWSDEAARLRFVAYYREQVRELMSNYGRVDILWYDGCLPCPLDGRETNEMVYRLQPEILINERLGEPFDYRNCEQTIHAKEGVWEACMTLNASWGYNAGDRRWKSAREAIILLLTAAGQGGNLLLNVGPRASGEIPAESAKILRRVGKWLRANGEGVYGTQRCPLTWNYCCIPTCKGNTVYLHFWSDPGTEFCYAELANKILSVRYLDGGKPVRFRQKDGRLFLSGLPERLPDPDITTLAIEVEGAITPIAAQKTFWIPG